MHTPTLIANKQCFCHLVFGYVLPVSQCYTVTYSKNDTEATYSTIFALCVAMMYNFCKFCSCVYSCVIGNKKAIDMSPANQHFVVPQMTRNERTAWSPCSVFISLARSLHCVVVFRVILLFWYLWVTNFSYSSVNT